MHFCGIGANASHPRQFQFSVSGPHTTKGCKSLIPPTFLQFLCSHFQTPRTETQTSGKSAKLCISHRSINNNSPIFREVGKEDRSDNGKYLTWSHYHNQVVSVRKGNYLKKSSNFRVKEWCSNILQKECTNPFSESFQITILHAPHHEICLSID